MKEIKISKLKNLLPKKTLRAIFWTILILIVLRGVVSIVRPNKTSQLYDNLNQEMQANERKINIQAEANSFAENFSREFLDYKQGQGEAYRKRLTNYMSQEALSAVNTSINGDVSVIDATAISSRVVSENKFDVEVRAKVGYSTGVNKDIFLRVPVTSDEHNYVVDDLPLFVAGPKIANVETKSIDGVLVDTAISTPIQEMLNNFLKVYTEGAEGETNYYLNDPTNALGNLKGTFKFKNISELKVYGTEEVDKYTALVNFTLEDPDNKQEVKQNAKISITYRDKRYYIENFETRFSN